MNRKALWALALLVVLAALSALAWWLWRTDDTQTTTSSRAQQREILYWVAPMDPNYRRDGPGKSPMGMDLIPVYANQGDEQVPRISAATRQNLGVRLGAVTRSELQPELQAYGVVEHNEDSRVQVTLRAAGWIENLKVFEEGESVKAGEVLFDFYSPDLLHAQDNYLRARAAGDERLARGALGQMRALAIPESRIRELQQLPPGAPLPERMRTLPYVAPMEGHIARLNVRNGAYVTPSQIPLELIAIESVWVLAEVFERQMGRLAVGQPADMSLSYFPGQRWQGQVDYIYPTLSPETRSQRVRLVFDNPGHQLKPDMFARVDIQTRPFTALSVPRAALIRTGRENRVVVADEVADSNGDLRFEAVTVEPGWEVGDRVVILDGLKEGQRIVTSGQFLLDSEASVAAAARRMQGAQPVDEAREMDHSGHSQSSRDGHGGGAP